MISVSIIEDDANLRAILHDWLTQAEGFCVRSEYSNAESALTRLKDDRPHVALVDINLPGQSGIECVRRLKGQMTQTQFLMLTVFEDGDHIFDALSAGASGYLLKRTPQDELLAAIREVNEGGSPMTSYIARKVVRWFQKQPPPANVSGYALSAREREILRQLARGHAYKEIAHNLGISIGTINTHVRRIYHKLHVSSRGEAVALFSNFQDEPRAPEIHDL